MLQIDKNLNGSKVEVLLGDSFEILLSENPTTGYRWQLHSITGFAIELQEDSFQRSGEAVGSGGSRNWRFRAIQSGTATVEMEYGRSWEKQGVQSFKITVHVGSR